MTKFLGYLSTVFLCPFLANLNLREWCLMKKINSKIKNQIGRTDKYYKNMEVLNE